MVKLVAGGDHKVDIGGVSVKYHGRPGLGAEVMPEVSRFERQALTSPEIMEATRTPFIGALFSYTAELNARDRGFEKETIHKDHAPVMELARHIKACSLFPNVYAPAKKHRTFSNVEVEGVDDSENGLMKKRKGLA